METLFEFVERDSIRKKVIITPVFQDLFWSKIATLHLRLWRSECTIFIFANKVQRCCYVNWNITSHDFIVRLTETAACGWTVRKMSYCRKIRDETVLFLRIFSREIITFVKSTWILITQNKDRSNLY